MCLKAFKTRFKLLKASLFPGFNPITPVFKSRVAYPGMCLEHSSKLGKVHVSKRNILSHFLIRPMMSNYQ
jgi:hypothetical protein